ncbi:Hypothetical protein, putative [Bodo saltans]|uniref:Ubiquitin-like domain-containing protein n=1 Tax=Bodo saltans TaxID=75058 RepID=A0A0S4ILT7_BODSA|nr:Hypothetical protein, putative [Bodo saltans]|eukprot:CUF31902.1 Hypothetical protein, putative [Bodo saltans]
MADMQSLITVINPLDGKRYKMNLKGDVTRLTVRKIKRYLVPSCNIPQDDQVLKYNGIELGDDVLCAEVGINSGSTLVVERRSSVSHPFVGSPQKHALEMETLDQQRAMLQTERIRRDEEFKRQQASLANSIAQAEKRRLDLERERSEKEYELKRLQELEQAAENERQRVAAVRSAEAERESLRARDLEARKSQLNSERNAQRQLEMQKLENERKKMLLAQQRAEYESERQRLERERREHHERRLRHELEIREKEVELERQRLEADRERKELEIEKMIADQQRVAELNRTQGRLHLDGSSTVPLPIQHNTNSTFHQSHIGTTPRTSALAEKQAELDRLRAARDALEADITQQVEIDAQIQSERDALSRRTAQRSESRGAQGQSQSQPYSQRFSESQTVDARLMAGENLTLLAQDLGVPRLELDDNNTCVVSVDDKYTLLVTFDAGTERLYLYSTLTTFIPKDPAVKLKLYEFLLEGSLLGREMCGGGVGASVKNDFILMSTSIYLPKASPQSLRSTVPLFVDSLVKWRNRVRDFLRSHDLVSVETVSERPQESDYPEYPMVGIEVTDGVVINGVHTTYSDGVVVVNVKGPAQRAGILANDFVRMVNGARIASLRDFQDAIKTLKPHSQVPFVVDRAGTQLVISVLVGSTTIKPGEGKYRNNVRVGGSEHLGR